MTMHVLDMNLAQLRQIDPQEFWPMQPEEFDHIFKECDALWLHSGDPKDPHAELTAGDCSDGFVDTLRVLRFTNLCQIMAAQLAQKLRMTPGRSAVDWVVGSDHAGATFSYAVAAKLGAQHDFTEKGPGKTQIWKRFVIGPDEVVLQVEELMTTTHTLQAVREGIRAGNPGPVRFFPLSLGLVHRSLVYEFEGGPILFFRHYDIRKWKPEDCPLCKAGSKRIRPKQNWAELTGRG